MAIILVPITTNGLFSAGTANINIPVPSGGIPAGQTIVGIFGCEGSSNLPILTDLFTNSYTTRVIQAGGTPGLNVQYCWNSHAIPNGSNLIISNIGSGVSYFYQLFYLTNALATGDPFDIPFYHTVLTSGTVHTVVASAAPAVANSMLIGFTGLGGVTFQFPTSFNVGWTSIGGGGFGGAPPIMGQSAQKISSTQDTFTANYASSFNGQQAIMAFKPAGSIVPVSHTESITISETSNGATNFHVANTEATTLADNPLGNFQTNPPVFESFPASDHSDRIANTVLSILETETISDTLTVTANLHFPHAETENLSDVSIGGLLQSGDDGDELDTDDDQDAVIIYNVIEHININDIIAVVFNVPEGEQMLAGESSDAVIVRTSKSAMVIPTVRLRSIHDVLTYREGVSDPTNSVDRDPMIYNPPRGKPPQSRK